MTAFGKPQGQQWSRVVRHLSVHDDSAELANGLRAGVGQASMEETAECTTEAGEGYEAMGIRSV